MTRIKKKSKNKYLTKINDLLFRSHYFPFILTFSTMGLLFVLFRMKSVEQDYKLNTYLKRIEESTHESKELLARKAKLLSAKNLRELATKHNLNEPKQDQIIVIP